MNSASSWDARFRSKASAIRLATFFACCALLLSSSLWAETVTVPLFANLQSLVNEYPAGTTFTLVPGIHRFQQVVPKNHDVFNGESGAVLSGAEVLGTFGRSGSTWTAHAQVTRATSYGGVCQAAYPACAYPEDLFFDSVPKTRVTSLNLVVPGKWYLDYSNQTVYMGDNPAGHTVEISILGYAFTGSASSVTINNLIIEKYATQAQSGAVDGSGSQYWNVEHNEVRFNHGMGIRSGNGMYINYNIVHNNGQLGLGGGGSNICVQHNQIYSNNYAGYDYGWEAGGVKFAWVSNLAIQYNNSHDNQGPGFWTDINSQDVLYDENETSNNKVAGILHEISYNANITGNYIVNDGFVPSGPTSLWYGAGILISNSANVTVEGNTVINCVNGIGGIMTNRGDNANGQAYLLQNLSVTGNTITQKTGTAAGIVVGGGYDNSVYTSWNNHFQNNAFNLTSPASYDYFYWLNAYQTMAWWNEYTSIH